MNEHLAMGLQIGGAIACLPLFRYLMNKLIAEPIDRLLPYGRLKHILLMKRDPEPYDPSREGERWVDPKKP